MRGSLCDPDRMPGDFDAAGGKPASIYNGRFFPGAASIFENNSAQGYILMGMICFLLGVCVTVLLYRLHRKNRENQSDEF